MKRTIYLLTLIIMAMPIVGNSVKAQHFQPHVRAQIGMAHIFQDRTKMKQRRVRRGRGDMHRIEVLRDRDRMSTARMWMLTDELDLSEDQAAKLFPRMKAHQKAMDELRKEERKLYTEFHKKADNKKATAKEIDKFVDERAKLGKKRIDLKTKFVKSTKDFLKPDQQAIFAVFEDRSRVKLRNRLMDSEIFIDMHDMDEEDGEDEMDKDED